MPSAATAEVKLRRALSPALATMLPAAPLTAPVTALAGLTAPALQMLRVTGFWIWSHLLPWSVGWVVCVWPGGGAGSASAAGAASSSTPASRAASTAIRTAQVRLGTWRIVVLLERSVLRYQLRGRGWGLLVGDRDRTVGGGGAKLLPVTVGPGQLDGGDAPALADRGAVDGTADPGRPDGDRGRAAVVLHDPPADRDDPQHHLGGVGGSLGDPEALGDQRGGLRVAALHRGAGAGGGQHVDRDPPGNRVQHQRAAQHGGVVGGGGDRALLGVLVADRHPVQHPPGPDTAGRRPGRQGRGGGGAGGRRGGRLGGGAGLGGGGPAGPGGGCGGGGGEQRAPQRQAAEEQHRAEQQHGEQAEPAAGAGPARLRQPVDHPCPALLAHSHDAHVAGGGGRAAAPRVPPEVGAAPPPAPGGWFTPHRDPAPPPPPAD